MPHKNITFKYLKYPLIKALIKVLIKATIKCFIKGPVMWPVNVYYMCLI